MTSLNPTDPLAGNPANAADEASAAASAAAASAAASASEEADEFDLMHHVVQAAHEAVDRLADRAIPAVERLRGGYSSAADSLRQRAQHAADLKDEWTDSLRAVVRERPLTALAAAVAVGVILARLTTDRDR